MEQSTFISLRKQYIEQRFSNLNEMQRRAALHTEGPLLILAGAGSGKTTVVVNRISALLRFGTAYQSDQAFGLQDDAFTARLAAAVRADRALTAEDERRLKVGHVQPWNTLAITFPNKAAGEMKERIARTVPGGEDVHASTFHSACVRILRRDIDRLGFPKSFTIYDTDDSTRILKQIYKENNLDEKLLPLKPMLSSISRVKDEMLTPAQYAARPLDFRQKMVASVYAAYQRALKSNGALDFDDLIFYTVRLFEECPDVLDFYHDRYRYIMVDEYQDTSVVQSRLVKLLGGESRNVCVVGDDDQSIYRFRGATIENILGFERDFPGAQVIRLEQNYRSTENILAAANDVISNNIGRRGKTLWTAKHGGAPVTVYEAGDERDESAYVAGKINEAVREGCPLGSCAVLYRMNAQSGPIENYFARAGIPYKVVGGTRFYDRAEIKDILAYMSVVCNPADDLRLRRIINRPARKIGEATVVELERIAAGLGCPMLEVAGHAADYPSLVRAVRALDGFSDIMKRLEQSYETQTLADFTRDVITLTGYEQSLTALGDEGETRLQNVQELVSSVAAYCEEAEDPNLNDFLEQVALISDLDSYDSEADRVTLMTLHAAKGLEFDNVFIIGLEEGIFPSEQARFDHEAIEEERRLMYVGITRARRRLYLISAAERMLFGQTRRSRPSRFLDEIMSEHKQTLAPAAPRPAARPAPARPVLPRTADRGVSVHRPAPTQPRRDEYRPGDRVHHNVFGDGTVLSAVPMGGDVLLTIDFDVKGQKKTMRNYAPMNKI